MRRAKRRAKPRDSRDGGNQMRTYLIIGAVLVGVIGLGYLLYLNIRGPQPIEGVVVHPQPSRGHDNETNYEFGGLPPVGGVHHDIWQNCGIYDEPVDPANAIHSLEHGAVWLTYHPDLPDEQVTTLRNEARGNSFVLLSPYPDQSSPIVLPAWGVQLELESAQDGRIAEFIQRYQQGPQTPERGAACTQGVGTPIG